MSLTRRALNRRLAALPAALGACAAEPVPAPPARPWHHTADGFRNPPGSPERGGDFTDWASFFWRNLGRADEVPLPAGHVVENGAAAARLAAQAGDSLTWLGHACFLIRLGGRAVLTDPFLSSHASPVPPLGPERFAPAGLAPGQLPPVDLLLVSHNHYDHLDLPTLERLPGRERMEVITPLGLGSYFTARGYPRVREVDWYEVVEAQGLTVMALPAIHFSKRTLFDRNQTLWAGYAIERQGRRVLFTGDTAYGPVFERLGAELAGFDLSLLPIGAYAPRELMQATHCTPEEAVRIGRDLKARRLVAMHWGTIQLTDEPPFEPPGRFLRAADAAGYASDDVWIMAIGETRAI